MKLSVDLNRRLLESFDRITLIAQETKKEFDWLQHLENDRKTGWVSAPETFGKASKLEAAYSRYEKALKILDVVLSKQEISKQQIEELDAIQLPALSLLVRSIELPHDEETNPTMELLAKLSLLQTSDSESSDEYSSQESDADCQSKGLQFSNKENVVSHLKWPLINKAPSSQVEKSKRPYRSTN
jgi:hypothetical protein